ncbi:DUF317 domain-containing protein [Streptomyces sp. B1866]|uniref:DUF317 domain-containing protein n=1 Tax=Streptomyces sp. B1866 TaxID=3075431 RepID=UPI002890B638|nr:DUF317 domain-containing protein [Streptomyces sp. B1866]MDT3395317.1 DUF317 domain-containing protein [Streptomyces sp. B1866]
MSPNDDHPHRPADTELLAGPVYLVGPGNPALITEPLRAATSWAEDHTPAGHLFTSPCLRTQIARLPKSPHGGWKVTHSEKPLDVPVWSATFSRDTPAEIVAAFTTPLAAGAEDDERGSPGSVLAARGWQTETTEYVEYHVAPGQHAHFGTRLGYDRGDEEDQYLELVGAVPVHRTMYVAIQAANGPRWHAQFTSRTPPHLVTAAVDAFSSPDPVRRRWSQLPERHLPYLTTRPAAHPRAEAARARTTTRAPATATTPPRTPAAHPGIANPRRTRR